MRFTSPYAQFKITAVKQRVEWLANGQWRELSPGYICRFEPNAFTQWEKDEALRVFGDVVRLGQRKTDATLTVDSPLGWRIGTFDTDTIPDEDMRKRVEKALLEHESYGRSFAHFPKPKTPAPWKNYDNLKAVGRGNTKEAIADEVVRIAREIGADPGTVMAYEMENQNRPDVVAALERWANRAPDEDEIVVAA